MIRNTVETTNNFSVGVTLELSSKHALDILPSQLNTPPNNCDHVELWIESEAEILLRDNHQKKKLARALGEHSCTVHAPFADLSLTSIHKEIVSSSIERMKHVIDVSEKIGAIAIALHPGKWLVFEEKQACLERFASHYAQLQHETAIPLCVENLKPSRSGVQRNLLTSFDDISNLVTTCDTASLTLDTGHALQSGLDVTQLSKLAPHIKHIHAHELSPTGGSHQALSAEGPATELLQSVAAYDELAAATITLEVMDQKQWGPSIDIARAATTRQ